MAGMIPTCTPVRDADGLAALIDELGFLPFIDSPVPGFSLRRYVPPEKWFTEESDGDGPWEWKGAHIGRYAYGKLFHRLAGFVSLEYLPLFISYRRNGYDFEGYYEDGLATHTQKLIYDALERNGPMLSPDLKRECGFGARGAKDRGEFDAHMARLQMTTFVTVACFEYALDRHGKPYGWGLARYALTEQLFDKAVFEKADATPPEKAYAALFSRARALNPGADDKALTTLLKK